ncbi:CD59 glycoprotein-like [Phyllobates terribilis]|uniref:CD59 glycoprotein-like n=1 Tax=Phyllobates terribilis TaxID=111132 RepID=UPI003CCAE0CA
MNTIISLVLIIVINSQTGDTLNCYECAEECGKLQQVTCRSPYEVCQKWSALGEYYRRCGPSYECNFAGFKCCKTDLCNSAINPKMSKLLGVTALVILWMAMVY